MKYALYTWITSNLIVLDVIFAYHMNHICIACFNGLCVITSNLYWSHVFWNQGKDDIQKNWKRILDMTVSIPLYLHHIHVAYLYYLIEYLIIAGICGCLYIVSHILSDLKYSYVCHSLMHIFGVAANIYLYYKINVRQIQRV